MVSKRYFVHLVIRLILISLTCFVLCLSFFAYPNYSVIIILATLFVVQVIALVRYLNQINKKLENFFLFYLSGDVASSNLRRSPSDEFNSLYMYFDLITEKLEQARLKNEVQNTYFKTIVDETAVGLISFKPDGSVELFNEAAKRMFGIKVLRNLRRLNTLKDDFSDILIEMQTNDRQLITLVVDGELVQLATKKVKFRTMNEELHLVSFQNIKPELEEREIESWQKLIRVLMHEIKNSLTPIMTLVGSLRQRIQPVREVAPSAAHITDRIVEKCLLELSLINARGKGLVHFVENYRTITKLPEPKLRTVNLYELLQRVADLHMVNVEEHGISISVSCRPSLFFRADDQLLEQVLINLVKNSCEALEGMPDAAVELSGQSAGEHVLIRIADNGRGIPSNLLDQVFVPFFTTKSNGSGIGLSLSRQIIRLHGGSLTVKSSPGNTVFTIRI